MSSISQQAADAGRATATAVDNVSTTITTTTTTSSSTKNDCTATAGTGVVLHVEIPIRSSCPVRLDRLRLDWENYFRQEVQQQATTTAVAAARIDVAASTAAAGAAAAAASIMITMEQHIPELLRCHVDGTISMETSDGKVINSTQSVQQDDLSLRFCKEIRVHPYFLSVEEATVEELPPPSSAAGGGGGGGNGNGDELDGTSCGESLQLPHASLRGLWDTLIFDSDHDNDDHGDDSSIKNNNNNNNIKQNLLNFAHSALLFADKHVDQHIVHWNRLILLHGSK
jgi:hypothetical protein